MLRRIEAEALAEGQALPGLHLRQPECQRYLRKSCGKRFDDLAGTIFAGRRQPLSAWFSHPHLMGLNQSNRQIVLELGLDESDGQAMAEQLRGGIVERRPKVRMGGVVERGEVYVVAGHKGSRTDQGARAAPPTWASSSSSTTSGAVAGPCSDRSSTRYCSQNRVLKTQYEPQE